MNNLRADYETLGMFLATIFRSVNTFSLFILIVNPPKDNNKQPVKIDNDSERISLVFLIHDAIRVLDRQGLINSRFFDILVEFNPQCNLDIQSFAKLWRQDKEPQRLRTDSDLKKPIEKPIDLVIEILLSGGQIRRNHKSGEVFLINNIGKISKLRKIDYSTFIIKYGQKEGGLKYVRTINQEDIYIISEHFKY